MISIFSEQNGIKRRIKEINKDLILKQEINKGIEDYLFEDDLGNFINKKNIKKFLMGW